MGKPHAAVESYPLVDLELILQEQRSQAAGRSVLLVQGQAAPIGGGQAELVGVALAVAINAHAHIVAVGYGAERDLGAPVLRIEAGPACSTRDRWDLPGTRPG